MTDRAAKIAEVERLRKVAEVERLRAEQKPAEAPMGGLESAISGAADALTFGRSDEISGALRATVEAPFSDKSWKDLYRGYQQEHDAYKAKARADNPWWHGGGQLGAGVLAAAATAGAAPAAAGGGALARAGAPFRALWSATLPKAGATTMQNAARAGLGGALYASGASKANLDTQAGAEQLALDTAGGGALGFAAGGILDKAGKALTGLRPSNLRQAAADRAVKAGTGQNLKAIRQLRAAGAADDSGQNALSLAGRNLLKRDEAGPAVVGWGSRVESILPAAQAKKQFFGTEIGKVAGAIDEAMPGAVDGTRIAARIRDYAAKVPQTEGTKGVLRRLEAEAARFEQRGAMSFADAQRLKGAFKFDPVDTSTHAFGKDASNALNSILRTEMNETARNMAQVAPKGSELASLAGRYGDLKGKYQTYKAISEAAQKRVDANLSNRFASPSDYGMGAVGALTAVAQGGGAGKAALYGAATAAVNKLARERGSAFAATGMNKLAGILESSPQILGKFGALLERAAQRSPAALFLTHQLLLKDPQYQAIIDNPQP